MKRSFLYYFMSWLICFIIFQVVVFVTPEKINGISKYRESFWIGYCFIIAAFFIQLFCARLMLCAKTVEKIYRRKALQVTSYAGLVVMIIAGSICMFYTNIKTWQAVILCVCVFGFIAIWDIRSLPEAFFSESYDAEHIAYSNLWEQVYQKMLLLEQAVKEKDESQVSMISKEIVSLIEKESENFQTNSMEN